MDVLQWMENNILIFDGANGTMFQRMGLKPGALPELLNFNEPDMVTSVHRAYVEAGADVVTANTFQANELKLGREHSVPAVIEAAIACALRSKARFVALDVGPLGQLMEPMGTLRFERAYEFFRDQMVAGERSGADIILIETIADPYEAKAAILAAKENTKLPVFCTMTFQEDGRTFVGCDALTAATTLQGLGVDALGINCSLGPEALEPAVKCMLEHSRLPVMVQANAGLPAIRDGQTVYDTTAEEFAGWAEKFVDHGVRIIGGCCGTSPEFISLIRKRLKNTRPLKISPKPITACSSGTRTVVLGNGATEIGERLNPTGKKPMQQALLSGDLGYITGEAIAQAQAGAQVLDINVGLPTLNEPEVMARVVREVQSVVDTPLQIDSADPAAIEAGIRVYNGKPIINSVNGKREVMEQIFPIAKKYGALVIGLTLDEKGIPPTAEGRLEIARTIKDTALEYGIPPEDLLIDCLVLTVSAQQAQARETLRAIGLVKNRLGLKTVLGVSNVSFGMPSREAINAVFLATALGAGLDAAIINPLSPRYREVLDVFYVLSNQDKNAAGFISKYSGKNPPAQTIQSSSLPLSKIIEEGRKDQAAAAVRELLQTLRPLEIIDNEFIPALERVGRRFEAGEIFLPQLMQSAQAVQKGFELIKEHMELKGEKGRSRGKILLATVYGDIHDLGKNIVRMLLENYGYDVLDLGRDVPVQAVVEAIRRDKISLVGLSALMTTTVKSMKDTIEAVRSAGLDCTFFVGGAVLNEEYARFVGAEHYAKDAMAGVQIANRFFGYE